MSKISTFISGLNPQALWVKAVVLILACAALIGAIALVLHLYHGQLDAADKRGYARAQAEHALALAESNAKVQAERILGLQVAEQDTAALAGFSQGVFTALREADDANEKRQSNPCGVDLSVDGRLFTRKKRAD